MNNVLNQTCTHCQLLNDHHGIPTNYTNHVVLDCPRIKAGMAARSAVLEKQSIKTVQGESVSQPRQDGKQVSQTDLSMDFTQLALGGGMNF